MTQSESVHSSAATSDHVLEGSVTFEGDPVARVRVRLLGPSDELTDETFTAEDGTFRFHATPGRWVIAAIHSLGRTRTDVVLYHHALVHLDLDKA